MGIKDVKIDSIDSLSYGVREQVKKNQEFVSKYELSNGFMLPFNVWSMPDTPLRTYFEGDGLNLQSFSGLYKSIGEIKGNIEIIYVDSKRNQVVIKWKDGEISKGTCNVGCEFDIYEGFVVALVKRFFGSNSKIFDFIEEKLPGKQKHYVEECKKSWGYRDKRDKKNKKKKDVNDDVYTIIEDVCFAKADVAENTEGDSTDKEVETENLFCLFDE